MVVPLGQRRSNGAAQFPCMPAHRRAVVFPKHTEGWEIQLQNIARHLDKADAA